MKRVTVKVDCWTGKIVDVSGDQDWDFAQYWSDLFPRMLRWKWSLRSGEEKDGYFVYHWERDDTAAEVLRGIASRLRLEAGDDPTFRYTAVADIFRQSVGQEPELLSTNIIANALEEIARRCDNSNH